MKTESLKLRSLGSRWLLFAGVLAATAPCVAQQPMEPSGTVKVEGSASVELDLYENRSGPDPATRPRRPASLLRLALRPTISIGEDFSLPLNFLLSLQETTTLLARPETPAVDDIIQNPVNSFGLAPKLGWAQFNLGTQSPRLSELSGGDIQLFGLGVDLTPGKFRLVAVAGNVGQAVAADSIGQVRGEFARRAYMGKLEFVDDQTEFGLNIVRVRDLEGSIPTLMTELLVQPDSSDSLSAPTAITARHPLMPLPEESFTASLNVRVPVADGIKAVAEIGASLFTRDLNADPIGEQIALLAPVMTQRLSTRVDAAATADIEIARENWGVTLHSAYVGPGFRTLAFPWMEADRLDVTLVPRFQMFDGGVSMNGSIGWRRNNLSMTEEATTAQLLGSASADVRISDAFSLSAQFSNYGQRTPVRNDTFKVETVARSISLTPSLTLGSEQITQSITASAAIDDYTDRNPISGAEGTNHTRSVTGNYSLSMSEPGIGLNLAGAWLVNRLKAGDLTIVSGSAGADFSLLDGAVSVGTSGLISRTTFGSATDEVTALAMNGTWRISTPLRLRVEASATRFKYATASPGRPTRENLLRTSLHWQW